VTEVSREERGLKLKFEGGSAEPPAKVSVYFRARDIYETPITTLNCSHFTLFEDNEPVSRFESAHRIRPNRENFRLSALLLVDLSGSIVKPNLVDTLKRAVTACVGNLLRNAGDSLNIELGIDFFDGRESIFTVADFAADTARLLPEVRKINAGLSLDNSTNLNGAVIKGIEKLNGRVKRNTNPGFITAGSLVVFTDGKDRAARIATAEALKRILSSGLNIYTIGLRGELDEITLAQFGKDGSFFAESIQNLVGKFIDVAKLIRDDANSRYLLEYCSPSRKGKHQLKIEATDTKNFGRFASLTVSFSADGFAGGCNVDSVACRD
jgi:hypothetical protein